MPLSQFEECWPLPTESLPELAKNLNIVTLTLTLLANQLWSVDFLIPPRPLIIPHRLPWLSWISYDTQKLMLDSCKMLEKRSEAFHAFLWHFVPNSKQNFIAYRSFKVSSCPDCIFEIHQLWQLSFSRVYSNCYCSCWFEAENIEIGQSSHKMSSNNILNF